MIIEINDVMERQIVFTLIFHLASFYAFLMFFSHKENMKTSFPPNRLAYITAEMCTSHFSWHLFQL